MWGGEGKGNGEWESRVFFFRAYGWVVVGECVVDAHVFKVMPDVGFKEPFDFFVVEFRIHEDCADVCFDDVGKALQKAS